MNRPLMALMLAALLWGGAVTGTKYALGGFGPVTLLAVELTAAAAVLWVVTLVRGYRPPRRWWVPVLLGLLEPAVAYLAETAGLSMTSAVSGAVITGLESALVVTLAGLLLRERVTPAAAGAVAVAVAGLLVLARAGGGDGAGGHTSVTGDLLMAAGVLCAALYTITARRFSDGSDVASLTAWQFTVAAAVAVPAAATRLASGAEAGPAGVPARFWVAAVLVGVAGYGLSFLLFNRAIGETEAGWAAIVLNLIPVFGFLSAVALLSEPVSPGEAGGAALVGASVLYFTLAERRAAAPETGGSAGERVGVGTDPHAPVQRGDHLVVVGGELEVEDADVLPDPGRGDRLGEHDVAALDVPAQHHLGRGLAGPLGDRHDLRVAEEVAATGQR
jgi:O-acetylserine/cysteine efflux transporter